MTELAGPWQVSFDPRWGGPANVTFEKLEDWTRRPEPGIRHYSGTAVYRQSFDLPAEARTVMAAGKPLFLDLGTVKELAEVRLNGQNLGVVWCPPWRVEITAAVREKENMLELNVVNFWPNRLIGDAALPPEKRRTATNITKFTADSPLMESGLLGPVTLQLVQETHAMTRRTVVLSVLLAVSLAAGSPGAEDALRREFLSPPDSAKAWCYWWWLNGAASKEGITRDFEEMKKQGIAGALLFDAGEAGPEAPRGPHFMSAEWRELYKHAVREADRCGIVLGVNLCSGWNAGGPWVTPEHAAKKLVAAQTVVKGPGRVTVALPKPQAVQGFYRDIAVLAVPVAGQRGADVQRWWPVRNIRTTARRWPKTATTRRAGFPTATSPAWGRRRRSRSFCNSISPSRGPRRGFS